MTFQTGSVFAGWLAGMASGWVEQIILSWRERRRQEKFFGLEWVQPGAQRRVMLEGDAERMPDGGVKTFKIHRVTILP